MKTTAAKIVGPSDGKSGFLGSIGVRFMIDGEEAAGRFALGAGQAEIGRVVTPDDAGDHRRQYGYEDPPHNNAAAMSDAPAT
jgi:hypothetical protein